MNKLRGLVCLLVVLFSIGQLEAQQYSFINYSTEEGLPQSQVRAITQDSLGFLWIATLGGVSRYDGYTFENFSVLDGMLGNQVSSLTVDKDGLVWMGLQGGLSVFNGDTITSFKFNKEHRFKIASSLYADQDTLWIITNRGGLIKFYNHQFDYFPGGSALDSIYVQSIMRNSNGEVLIGARSGIFSLENRTITEFTGDRLSYSILDIVENDGILWVASRWDGLFNIKGDSIKQYYQGKWRINDIVVRNKTEVWTASSRGVSKWNGSNFKIFNADNGLSTDNVTCLFVDRENILWIGTNGGGIFKFSGELITTTTTKDGLSSNLVMSIVEDAQSDLWIATYDRGLNRLSKDSTYTIEEEQGLINNQCWSIAYQDRGTVWVGTNIGLSKVSGSDIVNFSRADGLLDNKITALFMDKEQGELWMGSANGYTVFKDGVFTSFDKKAGFMGVRLRNIKKDKQGNMWFGCGNGLFKFDGTTYKKYTILEGLTSNTVFSFAFEGDRTWIGTELGLSVMENDKITQLPLGKTTGDLLISFLLNDKRGRIWAGTNNGIYVIQPQTNGSYSVEHYNKGNGLSGLECNMNAVFLDADGNIYAGLETGLIRFDRKELDNISASNPPTTVIKGIKLYLKKVNWNLYSDSLIARTNLPKALKLQPDDNYLTFEFSGINFRNPKIVQYRFKLLGAPGKLSEEWSTPTVNNIATFSNLPSGNYTFKVQASNESGIWPDKSTDFSFIIITPYYATWWFRTLLVLFFGGIISLIVYWRLSDIRQKRENKRLKDHSKMLALEQQTLNANMNSHFVFNSLNSIQYYLNNKDPYSANLYLSRFAKLIRKNLDSSQMAFTSIAEEIERMKLYLGLEQMRFKDRFTYNFSIDDAINIDKTLIPSMLFQPYLENSIWHGILPAQKTGWIKISMFINNDNYLNIEILDNGIGIRTSQGVKVKNKADHVSKGMDITKARLDLYKHISSHNASVIGPIELSENGKPTGTRVALILPLINNLNEE